MKMPTQTGSSEDCRQARPKIKDNRNILNGAVGSSVEQNEWFCLYVFQDDMEFTHYQDKGIWKTEFPAFEDGLNLPERLLTS